MPFYEYQCRSCGEAFEQMRKISDDDREVECPKCHEKNAERLISLTSASGWLSLFTGGSSCGSGGFR